MASTKLTRQFSLRWLLLTLVVLAVCFAVAGVRLRLRASRRFEARVSPITQKFVCSVGHTGGRIVWLRFNSIDPHHPEAKDSPKYEVPVQMSMWINDGRGGGPYKALQDVDIARIVNEHPYLLACDLRGTHVTGDGLAHLRKLKRLQWLWLDDRQCTEAGIAELNGISSLRTVWIEKKKSDSAIITKLATENPDCTVLDADTQYLTMDDRWSGW